MCRTVNKLSVWDRRSDNNAAARNEGWYGMWAEEQQRGGDLDGST